MKPANTTDKLKAVVEAMAKDKEKKSTQITNNTGNTNNQPSNPPKK